MNEELRRQLHEGLHELGIALPQGGDDRLLFFCDLLLEANARMNLTAVTDPTEVISRHFLDSLAPLSFPEVRELFVRPEVKLIDVGTGAGFPGAPLAIALPEVRVTLLDSLQKRIGFLEEAVHALGLQNITTKAARAEDAARMEGLRGNFDIAVSRAVSDLSPLLECSVPFLKENGVFYAYKGEKIEEEMGSAATAMDILGVEAEPPLFYRVAGDDATRSLLPIRKVRPTPDKFPRRAGIPKKRPL